MAVVLATAAIAPTLSRWLRLPALVICILTGAVLGTNGLGLVDRTAELKLLEQVGLLFIMVQAGLQMNLEQLDRTGIKAVVFGLLTFGVPFAIGFGTGQFWMGATLMGAVLMGLVYSPHALVSYPIAAQLGIQQLEVVNVAAGGTLVTSVLTLAGYAIVRGIHGGSLGPILWLKLLGLLPLLVVVAWVGLGKLGDRLLSGTVLPPIQQVTFVLASVFGLAVATDWLGVDAIVGAFVGGLALNRAVPNDSPLMHRIEAIGNSIFVPGFLFSVGVLSNGKILFSEPESVKLAAVIIVGAVGTKVAAAWLAGRLYAYSTPEEMVIAGLTMSRAPLILVIGLFAWEAGLLTDTVLNALILYVAITILIGPIVTEFFGRRLKLEGAVAAEG